MKDAWQTKTLEEVCQFSSGLWKGKKPPFVNVGVIRNTNFSKEGTLNDSDIAYLDVEAKMLATRRLQCGDIILEKSGGGPKQPVGRVVLFDKEEGDFSFSNFTAALRIIDPHDLDFRFLHKFLHWTYLSGVTEGMQSHSTGIRNLDGEAYKAIKISFPRLREQRRIVGVLDESFDAVATAKANAEKNHQNARALFEDTLQAVFTRHSNDWSEKTLKQVAVAFGRGKSRHRPRGDVKLLGGQYPLIQTGDISNSHHWIVDYSQTYNEIGLAQSKLWPKGTICIAIVGANVAETAVLDFEACFPDSVIGIVVNEEVANNEYVEYLLQSFRTVLKEKGKGTARDNINLGTFEHQKFPFPKLAIQNEIVSRLNNLDEETKHLESIYERKLEALETLKKSLLHQAFTAAL